MKIELEQSYIMVIVYITKSVKPYPGKNPKPKFQLQELQAPRILCLSFKAKVYSPPVFAPFGAVLGS